MNAQAKRQLQFIYVHHYKCVMCDMARMEEQQVWRAKEAHVYCLGDVYSSEHAKQLALACHIW